MTSCLVSPALAQFGRPIERSASFIEAPRSVSQYLREAERAIEEKRYSDAVIRLGDLLEGAANTGEDDAVAGQDYFLDDSELTESRITVRRQSLLGQARKRLGELPETGWETYELRYGPAARKALNEAVAGRDLEGLRAVRRKYFHTKAGYQASLLLAQDEMFQGHPLAASILLDEVVATPRAVGELGQAVVLLHAAACRLAERDLPKLTASTEFVSVAGQREPWPTEEDLAGWVESHYATGESESPGFSGDHRLAGATLQRNGNSAGEMPLSMEYWMQRAAESPRQERQVRETKERLTKVDKLPPPSWVPLRVGDYVLMRSTEHLFGVDFKTGKLVWEFPWGSPSELHQETEGGLGEFDADDDPANMLIQRIWNDLPYGQISSDGERVYLLDDLAEAEVANYGILGQRGRRPGDVSRNTLVALTLESQGKLAWSLGMGEESPSPFSEAFFLGPPLPVDGRLYVLAELAGDISLCCLDPRTGEEYWRQQLVAIESMGINTDPVRRIAGAVPTYHQGVLICPTSSSAVVAVDLADRTLRWGAQLQRNKVYGDRRFGVTTVDQMQLIDRWADGAAIASGRSVLVTPIESDRLYCLELLTGRPCFDGLPRSQSRYLAGIRDDRFFLVGDDVVEARDLSTGQRIWETATDLVSSGQKISGRGMFGDHEYYLPTSTRELIRVSLKDGAVLDRRSVNYPLGNLVAVEGMVMSQSATDLAVAKGEESLEPEVREALSEDPDDFNALVGQAQLLIQRNQRQDALATLERLRRMSPEDDQVRLLSVVAMLGILRESPAENTELFSIVEELIDQPLPRAELITLRVRAALENHDHADALRQLLSLSDLVGDRRTIAPSFEAIVSDADRKCSIGSWIAARVAQLIEESDESQLQQLNALVRAETESLRNGSDRLLQRLIDHFGPLAGLDPIRDELVSRASAKGDTFLMEQLAIGNRRRGDLTSLTDNRLLMLGQAYANGGLRADAFRIAQLLRNRNRDGLAEQLESAPGVSGSGAIAARWPRAAELDWQPSRAGTRRSNAGSQVRYPPVVMAYGREMRGYYLARESLNPLSICGPDGVPRPLPIELDDSSGADITHARIGGGLMLVAFADRIEAFNLHRMLSGDAAESLWTISNGVEGAGGLKRSSEMNVFDDQRFVYKLPIGSRRSNPAYPGAGGVAAGRNRGEFSFGPSTGNSLLIHKGNELICVELSTGKQLWQNSLAPPVGTLVCDGRRVAIVSPAYEEIVFFDLLDGQMLERREWTLGDVWMGAGSNLLCIVPKGGSPTAGPPETYQVELFDPFSNSSLLQIDSPPANRRGKDVPAAYGHVAKGRYFTLFGTDGVATVWDLFEGTEIARVENLPQYPDLNGLRTVILNEQIVLAPKRRKLVRSASGTSTLQTSSPNCERADAALAIGLADGKSRWVREFEQPWGLTLIQPFETPALPFVRAWNDFQSTGQRVRDFEFVALDVRDGRDLVSRRRQVPNNSNSIDASVTLQPGRNQVRCEINNEVLTINFEPASSENGVSEDRDP